MRGPLTERQLANVLGIVMHAHDAAHAAEKRDTTAARRDHRVQGVQHRLRQIGTHGVEQARRRIRVDAHAMREHHMQGSQVRFGKHRGSHGDEPIKLRCAFRQLVYGPDERELVQFQRLRTLRKNLPQIGEVRVLQFLPGRRRIQHRDRGTEHVAIPHLLAHAQHTPTRLLLDGERRVVQQA